MGRNWCIALAEVVATFAGRWRFKFRGEAEAEPWGRWLIATAGGYLEVEGCGPYPVSELEWVEAEPVAGPLPLASAPAAAGVPVTVSRAVVRIPAPAFYEPADVKPRD